MVSPEQGGPRPGDPNSRETKARGLYVQSLLGLRSSQPRKISETPISKEKVKRTREIAPWEHGIFTSMLACDLYSHNKSVQRVIQHR